MFRLRSALLITALIILGSAGANAQNSSLGGSIMFDVPMDFVANGHMMTQGRYSLIRPAWAPDTSTPQLILRGENGKSMVLAMSVPKYSTMPATDTAMVFQNVGGRYYLSQVTYAGETTGTDLRVGPAGRHRMIARNATRVIYPTRAAAR